MNLNPNELELTGHWIARGSQVCGDATCDRIEWLINHHLRKLAENPQSGGWHVLFKDPDDGRFWERTYPQSHLHGGGPPRLTCISLEQALATYGEAVFRQ